MAQVHNARPLLSLLLKHLGSCATERLGVRETLGIHLSVYYRAGIQDMLAVLSR